MKLIKDKNGFSLIELIITMGIMAIFATAIFGAFGYINYGKTKQASNKLNTKLEYIQTETMTKKGNTYLYIYSKSNGVFTCIVNGTATGSPHDDGFHSRAELDTYLNTKDVGTKLCDSVVSVSGEDGAGSLSLSEDNMLKVGFDKSTGAFSYCNDGNPSNTTIYNCIKLDGKQKFEIQLVTKTGKHFIKKF